jgi:hypothetical protein
MIALETIGFALAVMIIVTVTFLLFIGGPRFRAGRPTAREPESDARHGRAGERSGGRGDERPSGAGRTG